jgi:hypothetical protein
MLALLALAVAAIFAALLAIPVGLRFDASAGETLEARLRVEWLFGRVARDLDLRDMSRVDRFRGGFDWRRLSPLLREAFRDRVAQLLRRWGHWIDFDEVRVRARLGLDDPADTGQAMGLIQPLLAVCEAVPHVDVRVEPDFRSAAFEAELHGGVRAVPAGLLAPLVAFALSPETLRTFWSLRSSRS